MESETNRNWEAEERVIKQELDEETEDDLWMARQRHRYAEIDRLERLRYELEHQLREADLQLLATTWNIRLLKKPTDGVQRELRNKRALCREIKKLQKELAETMSSWERMRSENSKFYD